MSPNNMSQSSSKWSRTRNMTEEEQHTVEMEARQTEANDKAYMAISAMCNGQLPEGDYRNLAGSHFKINAHGCRRIASPQEQILPLGYTWVPINPRGEVGKPFVWERGLDYPWLCEYQPVMKMDVGFNMLGMVADPNGFLLKAIQFNKLSLQNLFGTGMLNYKVVQGEPYDEARPWWYVSENDVPLGEIQAGNPPPLVNFSSRAPTFDFSQEEIAPKPHLPSGDGNQVVPFHQTMPDDDNEFAPGDFEMGPYIDYCVQEEMAPEPQIPSDEDEPPSYLEFVSNMTENNVAVPLYQDPEPDMAADLLQANIEPEVQQAAEPVEDLDHWVKQSLPNANLNTLPINDPGASEFYDFNDMVPNFGGSNGSIGLFDGEMGNSDSSWSPFIGNMATRPAPTTA